MAAALPAALVDLPDVLGPWPSTPSTVAAVELITVHEPNYLLHHSLRSYFYARHLGEARGLRAGEHYDDELLFLSVVLHDIGVTDEANGSQQFEVDGADRAARFVLDQGHGEAAAEVVWDSVALHTSPGIAGRKRPEIALANAGIGADILEGWLDQLPPAVVAAAGRRYPRLDLLPRICADITAQVLANPAKLVPFTFSAAAVGYVAPQVQLPTIAGAIAQQGRSEER